MTNPPSLRQIAIANLSFCRYTEQEFGEVSEWLIEQPWKGCVGLVPTAGSNPALSVNFPDVFVTNLEMRMLRQVLPSIRLSRNCPIFGLFTAGFSNFTAP